MTVPALPSFAKIRELRLGVRHAREDDPLRPTTRSRPFAPSHSERWQGEMLFAPLASAKARELCAFLEGQDGRVSPFLVTLTAGKFGADVAATAAVAVAPALGTDVVSLTVTGGPIVPGTLLTLGDPQSGPFQLFEAVAVSGGNVTVAPRVRAAFTTGSAVTIGTVQAKLCRAQDTFDLADYVGHSLLSLTVVEAL